jgi:hypothetical protein
LAPHVWPEILPLEIPQFVMRVEVLRGQPWSAFEAHHLHSRFSELGRKNTARRPYADNHDISLFRCHGSPL